jgi:hypothetical protein
VTRQARRLSTINDKHARRGTLVEARLAAVRPAQSATAIVDITYENVQEWNDPRYGPRRLSVRRPPVKGRQMDRRNGEDQR